MNFIGNYYKRGSNSTGSYAFNERCTYASAYFSSNWMDIYGYGGYPADPWSLVGIDDFTQEQINDYKQSNPIPVEPVTTDDAITAYNLVLADAGASFPQRDSVDERIIDDVIDGTGGIISDENDVGGWPVLESTTPPNDIDHDGMPDYWELEYYLDPNNPNDSSGDRDGDGYTNIEEYINWLPTGEPMPVCVIYVDANAAGANNGANWDDAYTSLQDALAVAQAGKNIAVAQGTYKPTESRERTATFQLINGVAIYGGYPAGGGAWAERNPGLYQTILSGDINVPDVNTDNSYHVVTASGTDANAILDGFTITAGNANGTDPDDMGGGMYNNAGNPTVANCIFTSNSALNGGGMSNDNSDPNLTNCTFIGNSASGGGGMWNNGSSPTLTNCTFSDNSADDGGGMRNVNSSNPTLTNCTFSGNDANNYGGGMYNYDSNPMVTGCTFSGNSALFLGGGMFNYDYSSPTVNDCTFSGNSADERGGGMYNYYSDPTVTNCILWGNTASIGAQIYR